MGELLILNGSPRAPRSHSRRLADLAAGCWKGNTVCRDILGADLNGLCAETGRASHVLLVFPLYADALPVPLLKFLTALEESPPQSRPVVSVLINCGFLEPHQNDVAVEMVRLFCRQNGYPFGSALKIGSGEAILDTPFRFLVSRQVRRLVRSMSRGACRAGWTSSPPRSRRTWAFCGSFWWWSFWWTF